MTPVAWEYITYRDRSYTGDGCGCGSPFMGFADGNGACTPFRRDGDGSYTLEGVQQERYEESGAGER